MTSRADRGDWLEITGGKMDTDFETLARNTAIPEGGVSLILLPDAIPRILVPAGREEVSDGKGLRLDARIEVATESIADRQRPRDLLLGRDLINSASQFSVSPGGQCLHLKVIGHVATKPGGLSAAETREIQVHRALRLDDSVTQAFARNAIRYGRVEVLYMTTTRDPRLRGRSEAAVTTEAVAALREVLPRPWWKKVLGVGTHRDTQR